MAKISRVISINGLPGTAKTLLTTAFCISHYKAENTLFKRLMRSIQKKPIYINNVYSNYPILLDKKNNIYSNIVFPSDLQNNYSFELNSLIAIDEIQLFYDSDEFKKFPKAIASFNQAHRHFGIKSIIYTSQHPSRIVKKLRNVIVSYKRIKRRLSIPIIHQLARVKYLNLIFKHLDYGLIVYDEVYDMGYYDEAFSKDKEQRKLKEIKKGFYIINLSKTFESYNSVYLKELNIYKPKLERGTFDNLDRLSLSFLNQYHKAFEEVQK